MANDDQGFEFDKVAPSKGPLGEDKPFEFARPEAPKPLSGREYVEDISRSALAKTAQAIPGVIMGAPGSIETFLAKDLPTLARGAYYTGLEKMDYISPKEAEEKLAQPLYTRETPMQEKGYASPLLHWPTYKGVTEGIKSMPPEVRTSMPPDSSLLMEGRVPREIIPTPGEYVGYEPKTAPGKIVGAGIEGAAQGLPGGFATMPGRVITGFAAGAGSEAAGQYTEGEPNEGFARLVGALGGGYAGAKVANALLPATVGRDNIAAALAEDFRKGQTPMSYDQFKTALADGTPVTITDIAGPATLKILSQYGNLSESAQSQVGRFNQFLKDRAIESGSRAGNVIQDTMGVSKLDADAIAEANRRAGRVTQDRIWSATESAPGAQAIDMTKFNAKLLDDPDFITAVNETKKNAPRLSDDMNIVVPKDVPAVPGQEKRFVQTERGLEEVAAVPGTPAQHVPGNLPFYHQVDRRLGEMITKAKMSGDKTLANGLQQTQNRLRDELDKVAPYRDTVGASRNIFVGEEAPQAGYDFAQSLITSRKNPFTRGQVKREFDNMTPENQEFLRLGVAARLKDEAESGNLGRLAKKFTEDKTFQRDMKHVLGDERYNQIYGSVLTENIARQADALKFLSERISPVGAGVGGAGAFTAYEIMNAIINGSTMASATGSPQLANKAMLGFMAAYGVKTLDSMAERRVANNILPLMFSKDPKDIARVAELAQTFPIVEQIFNKLNTTLAVGLTNVQRTMAQQEEEGKRGVKREFKNQADGGRITRKTGGKVSYNHEAEADRLIKMAEQAHKNHQKSTEPLLSTDDNTVAKALKVAQENI